MLFSPYGKIIYNKGGIQRSVKTATFSASPSIKLVLK
jgi:hypothetical protein